MTQVVKIDKTKLFTKALKYRIKNGKKWSLMKVIDMCKNLWISMQTWYNVAETGNSYVKTADKLKKEFWENIIK